MWLGAKGAARRWLLSGAVLLVVMLGALRPWGAGRSPSRQAAGSRLSFGPVASGYVALGQPGAGQDGTAELSVGRQPAAIGYLRFDVQGVGASSVKRATLLLYAYDASPAGYAVQAVAGPWAEGELSFANRPALRGVVGLSGGHEAAVLAAADVTGYITGDGSVSLALTSTSDRPLRYAGREAASRAPRLPVRSPARDCYDEACSPASKSTAAASTTAAVRRGPSCHVQYMLVCAMTLSAGGNPNSVRSSVVCASATSVVS
jgi:hypothetical protein